MNANELADAIQGSSPYGLDDAARMLRQQQAEIEALKATNSAIEQQRPYWAQGYSSDSTAAQCATSAMSELHKLLGVDNQTDAVAMLRQQQAEISVSENLVKHLHSENKQLRNENEELQAEIAILRKAQEK